MLSTSRLVARMTLAVHPSDGSWRRSIGSSDCRCCPAGYEVCTATDGRDALECIEHEAPCLILLDVMMSVMDGRTFARRLRAHPEPNIANMPIVLLTALPEARPVPRQIGAIDVIPKPGVVRSRYEDRRARLRDT